MPKFFNKFIPKQFVNMSKQFSKFAENLKEHFRSHWPRYVLSLVTSTFTYHAAYSLTHQIYYGVMAILLAEGMWMYWLSRVESYENWAQLLFAVIMFLVGSVAIITTDIASAILIANQNSTVALYQMLPSWVEEYITKVTPILASTNLIVYGLYEFFSDTNRDKRKQEDSKRKTARYIRIAEHNMQRMRAQSRVLKRKVEIQKLEARQIKTFGKKLVAEQKEKDMQGFIGWLKNLLRGKR